MLNFKYLILIFLLIIFNYYNYLGASCIEGYGIGSDYLQKIHAYAFQIRCPDGHQENEDNPLPEDKRELGTNDIAYKDEVCLAILIDRFPCYCASKGVEKWRFEIEDPTGFIFYGDIVHTPDVYYDWSIFGSPWQTRQDAICGCCECWCQCNFGWRRFYFTRYIACIKDEQMFGMWKLRIRYNSSASGQWETIKEWNVELKNIDRGRLILTLPDNPESILPDGLEIEPNTLTGGDTTKVSAYFGDCNGRIEGQTIHLSNKFKNGTGGHNHSETANCDEPISRDLYSYCGDFSQWDITTDKLGYGISTFTAPYYSGEVEIKGYTYNRTFKRESSKKLKVRVPNLVNGYNLYWVYLQPDNLNCVHGDLIHYYKQNAWNAFKNLAYQWYYSLHPNYKILKFTAGSLPWGGKFDDGECWSSHESENHHYHRQGLDCDISTSYTDGTHMNQIAFMNFVRRKAGLQLGDHNDYHTHVRYIGY